MKPKIQAYVDQRWFGQFEAYQQRHELNQSRALESILASFFGEGEKQNPAPARAEHPQTTPSTLLEDPQRVRDDLLLGLKKEIDCILDRLESIEAERERLNRLESELHYFKGIMWGESASAKEVFRPEAEAVAESAEPPDESAVELANESAETSKDTTPVISDESAVELAAETPVEAETLALVTPDESATESAVELANESAETPKDTTPVISDESAVELAAETPVEAETLALVTPDESATESAIELAKAPMEVKGHDAFAPSKYQQAILDWLANGTGHACCNAIAGSGKSSTLRMAAKQLEESGISPDDVKVIVFGKANSQDLINKFGPAWKESIKTLHSAGFRLLQQEVGTFQPSERVKAQKYRWIARDMGFVPSRSHDGELLRSGAIDKPEDLYQMIDLLRLTLSRPKSWDIEQLASHYNCEGIKDAAAVGEACRKILRVGEEQAIKHIVDYTDQVWLPVKWQLGQKPWFKPYKFVLVDECQDLNAAQLELSLMLAGATGRLLYVGDPRQAIMGFAGADNRSYEKILERTKATELPLSICYRCPRSHIDLVRVLFPDIPIEPCDNAPLGAIIQLEEKELDQHLKVGDMVLSRKTAPLVTLCIKLISRGIKATVKGRDIAETIKRDLQDISKMPGFTYGEFPRAAQQYKMLKLERYHGLDNEEQLTEQLNDKLEALLAIYKSRTDADSIAALGEYIDSLFSDETSPITLSTCHRAKGLEGDRIFIIKPEDLPFVWRRQLAWQKEQENNLHYVALTRSKRELFVVGEPNWLPQVDSDDESANGLASASAESAIPLTDSANESVPELEDLPTYEKDILLSESQLAGRFKVGIPTVRRHAAKEHKEFSAWALRKDPDGLDWVAGPDRKSFRPALPKLPATNLFGELVPPELEYRHNLSNKALADLRVRYPG